MILTGREIARQVELSALVIDPFDERLLNPNSYNYRLGPRLAVPCDTVADPKLEGAWRVVDIPQSGFVLQPHRLYLGHTFEQIGSDRFVTSLIGRSSVGRLGLYLQLASDLGQLGAVHRWTLELTAVQPLRVYPKMAIGQVSFWVPEGEFQLYDGRYRETNDPTHSLFFLDDL